MVVLWDPMFIASIVLYGKVTRVSSVCALYSFDVEVGVLPTEDMATQTTGGLSLTLLTVRFDEGATFAGHNITHFYKHKEKNHVTLNV